MKNIFITLIVISAVFISACTKQTLYITPQATGYIYDSVTKKPLSNLSGNVGFSGLTSDESSRIQLKEDGSFVIKPFIKNYYYFHPNTKIYDEYPLDIFIDIKKHKIKIIDYTSFAWEQIPKNLSGTYNYRKIDLGVIYLDPEK